ncbi:hypothetical protein TYRP_010195, partial [Tyrophagus putrescentiae]
CRFAINHVFCDRLFIPLVRSVGGSRRLAASLSLLSLLSRSFISCRVLTKNSLSLSVFPFSINIASPISPSLSPHHPPSVSSC